MERKAVSKKNRFEVFKRDSFTCQYCGKSAPNIVLEIDHIIPVSKGGDNKILNLITSCFDCNRGKSNRQLNDDTIVTKQQQQAKLLQERKSQIEMMAKWQMSLLDNEFELSNKFNEFWGKLTNHSLTDSGLSKIKIIINKHGFNKACEFAKKSYSQYSDDINKAFNYIPKLINSENMPKDLKEAYYLRGVLKNRLYYVDDYKSLNMLRELLVDYEYSYIYNLCSNVRNWTGFINAFNDLVGE